jgi:hypothetical protein
MLGYVVGTVGGVAALSNYYKHEVKSAIDRALTSQYLKT